MAERARTRGVALRPVAKIHKSAEIARRQIAAGGIGVCCATLAECEVMVDGGIPGVLLFTSVVTPPKLERLAALNARADDLVVVADDAANLRQLAAAGRASGRPLQVLIDVEVGGGRTGVADERRAVELAALAAGTDGLGYAGVQGYVGGHQNIPGYEERRRRSRELLQPLVRVVERLRAEGLAPRIATGGGTGTHDMDHELGVLTELQVGSYVFMDQNYHGAVLRRDEPHPFQPALFVRSTVVSTAQDGFVICDAGVKELDAIFGIEHPLILRGAPPGSVYSLVGDDMGRIDLPPGERLSVGDVVEVLPPHCYQTLILYPHYHVVRGDVLVDLWPVDARSSG